MRWGESSNVRDNCLSTGPWYNQGLSFLQYLPHWKDLLFAEIFIEWNSKVRPRRQGHIEHLHMSMVYLLAAKHRGVNPARVNPFWGGTCVGEGVCVEGSGK